MLITKMLHCLILNLCENTQLHLVKMLLQSCRSSQLILLVIVLWQQYLKLVRQLDGYGKVVFPHCPCDSRKGGNVVSIVGWECFKLQACKEDGTVEVCCLSFKPYCSFKSSLYC